MGGTAILAAISGSAVVNVVIWLVIAGVIWYLLNWLISYSGIGDPFAKVARVILAVIVVVILINALLTLAGKPIVAWP